MEKGSAGYFKDTRMALTTRDMLGLPMLAGASFFMQALDSTILNTAIPAIASDLRQSPFSMQLAVVGYTLTVALLIPLSGWMADRFGTRRTYLASVAVFALGSLLCALSTSLPMLVAARVVQGMGGAVMMPISRLALMRAYRRDDFIQAFNFISIPGLVGPIVGPILGGWLVTYASWHWVFLINIPIGALGFFYGYRIMPDFRAERGPFDALGFGAIGLGVLAVSAGLELTGGHASSPLCALVLAVTGFACLAGYVRHARRAAYPLIGLGMFKTRTFAVGIAGNVVARLGIGSIPFLVPLLLQVGLGYPADVAGLLLLPSALGSLLTKTFVLRVLHRLHYRRTLLFLTVSIGVVFALLSLQRPGWPLVFLAAPLFIQGMLMSAQFTAMNTITLGDLSAEHASDGNSLLSVTQNLSISFGVAISTAALRFFSASGGTPLDALHRTFIMVGIMTALAAFVFMLLRPGDGDNLLGASRGRIEKPL